MFKIKKQFHDRGINSICVLFVLLRRDCYIGETDSACIFSLIRKHQLVYEMSMEVMLKYQTLNPGNFLTIG